MAARALWKAVLKMPGVELPVRLYPAVRDRQVRFHLLHDRDHVRVREHFVEPADAHVVESAEVRRGYPVDRGEYVVLDAHEQEELVPKPSRDIRVTHAIALQALPLAAYGHPYWLGPDGAKKNYDALAQSLARRDQQLIASWVMRGKHHFGALRAHPPGLALIDLHGADQWLALDRLDVPEGRDLDARELAMAGQLIAALDTGFDHTAFHDTHRERVQAMIEAKAQGKKPARRRVTPPKASGGSLVKALSASLRGLK